MHKKNYLTFTLKDDIIKSEKSPSQRWQYMLQELLSKQLDLIYHLNLYTSLTPTHSSESTLLISKRIVTFIKKCSSMILTSPLIPSLLKKRLKSLTTHLSFKIQRKIDLARLELDLPDLPQSSNRSGDQISKYFHNLVKSMKTLKETYLLMEIEREEFCQDANHSEDFKESQKILEIFETPEKKKRKQKKRSKNCAQNKEEAEVFNESQIDYNISKMEKKDKTQKGSNQFPNFEIPFKPTPTQNEPILKNQAKVDLKRESEKMRSLADSAWPETDSFRLKPVDLENLTKKEDSRFNIWNIHNQFEKNKKAEQNEEILKNRIRTKRRSRVQLEKPRKRCNCKASRCLKLYCECFKAGVECTADCGCVNCGNGKIKKEDSVFEFEWPEEDDLEFSRKIR